MARIESRVLATMKFHWAKFWEGVERILLSGLASLLVTLSCVPIVARWLGRSTPPWVEPLLGIWLLWLTLAGAWAATGARRHICIDLLPHILPHSIHRHIRPWIHLFTAAIALALARFGVEFVRLQRSAETAQLFGLPIWSYSYAIPLAMCAIAWRSARLAWQEFRGSNAAPNTADAEATR